MTPTQAAAILAAQGVPADLRKAAERTREELGPTGSNYPDIRVLLAFAEQALAATKAAPAQAQQAEPMSEQQFAELWDRTIFDNATQETFEHGVGLLRLIEAAHGIGASSGGASCR